MAAQSDDAGMARARRALAAAKEEQRMDDAVIQRADAVQDALSKTRAENYWAIKVSALFRGTL